VKVLIFSELISVMKKSRIEIEKKTAEAMISVFCKGRRHKRPCQACDELLVYALQRLDKCPYGNKKPACKHCPLHCYKPAMREKIREAMRYSGPRMLWYYPLLAIRHKISQIKKRHRLS
jgi:hypothetical protein